MKIKKLLLTAVLFFNSALLTFNSYAQTPNQPGAGNCLSFNGTSNYVGNIGTTASYSFVHNTGIFTIESWIRLNSFVDHENMLVGNTPTGVEKGFWFELFVSGGAVRLRVNIPNGTGSTIISDSPVGIITDTQWHHVLAVGNGVNITFYIDGIAFVGSGTMGTFSTGPASRLLQIGDTYSVAFGVSGALNFNGQIDEVRIWNIALTQTQIRNNMCSKLIGNELGLVGYWRFDETTGNTAFDSSPNGNNGTGFLRNDEL